jgi:predicted dehydrogenase
LEILFNAAFKKGDTDLMKCGIIGCGRNVEDMYLPAIKAIDNLSIGAVCDINSKHVESFATKYEVSRCYDQVDDFLNSCQDLDFIIISTPGFTHYEICKNALENKHTILVEKPVALELEEAMALKDIANWNNLTLGVVHNYRLREPVKKAKKAQKLGILGEIYQFNAVFHGQSLFNEPSQWSWNETKNKVLLYEMMIHLLDLQIYFVGRVKQIISLKSKFDEILNTTTNIYALVEHENNAIGIIDFQLFSSSNYIGFDIFGTANDVKIKLQPHYLRIYSGTVHPIDEIYYDFKRIWDFGVDVLKNKFFKSRVNRRAQSHYEVLKLFMDSIEHNKPFAIDINNIMPTMEYAQMLSDCVYKK